MDNKLVLQNQFGEVSINTSSKIMSVDISVTLDHAVGATPFKGFRQKDQFTLFVPAIVMSDGLGAALLAAAGEIPLDYRPPVDLLFPLVVDDSAGTRQIGNLKVGADGSLSFYADAGTTGFTNAIAAAIPATAVTYNLV